MEPLLGGGHVLAELGEGEGDPAGPTALGVEGCCVALRGPPGVVLGLQTEVDF